MSFKLLSSAMHSYPVGWYWVCSFFALSVSIPPSALLADLVLSGCFFKI